MTATDAGLRFYAVWTLGWIGPDAAEAAPALIRTLADADDNVRRKAAYSLGRVASPSQPGEAIPVLMKAFEDKNDDVRQAAADAVANFGGKAVRPLIGVVESSTPVARLAAIAALGKIGGDAKDAIPVLKAFLLGSEGHPNLVADALGKIGKASIPVLLEGVDSGKTTLREHCISALGHIGADAASALVDLLGHKSVEVRRAAAGTLTPLRIGDKMVVLGLAYASHDPDTQVRHHAFQALQALGISAKLAAPKLNDLLVDADPNLRQQAFNLLRSIGEDPLPGLKKRSEERV